MLKSWIAALFLGALIATTGIFAFRGDLNITGAADGRDLWANISRGVNGKGGKRAAKVKSKTAAELPAPQVPVADPVLPNLDQFDLEMPSALGLRVAEIDAARCSDSIRIQQLSEELRVGTIKGQTHLVSYSAGTGPQLCIAFVLPDGCDSFVSAMVSTQSNPGDREFISAQTMCEQLAQNVRDRANVEVRITSFRDFDSQDPPINYYGYLNGLKILR